MAALKVVLVVIVQLLVVKHAASHVVPTSKQQSAQSGQAIGPSVIASLMTFSQELKTLEKTVQGQNQKIEAQKKVLDTLQGSVNSKASKHSVSGVSSQLRITFDLMREDLTMRKRDIERYRNKMNVLESMITAVESEYKEVEMKVDVIEERFDDMNTKCRSVKTSWNHRANGELMFLDRHHLRCRSNEFLHSFLLMRRSDYDFGMIRYVYECCKYNI